MSISNLLQKHQWIDCIILVFANDMENEDLKSQWQNRQSDPEGYQERNLKMYLILTDKVLTEEREKISEQGAAGLRQRFGVQPDEFRLILLAKDGSEKVNSSFPVSNQKLFAVVDASPLG